MPIALKTQNDSFAFVHELKQEMHADLKYVESLEKEVDELESDKAEFSNMYDISSRMNVYIFKECECLAQKLSKQTEFVSKEVYTKLLRSFAKLEKHSISLELTLQQCQEQMKNDTVCKEKASNVFLKEREQYFEIQDLKAQLAKQKDKDNAYKYTWGTPFLRFRKDETPPEFLKISQDDPKKSSSPSKILVRNRHKALEFLNNTNAFFKEKEFRASNFYTTNTRTKLALSKDEKPYTRCEAARTMLSASKLSFKLWAEAIFN
ncbi:hypothetical protein Tco_0952763 [Tanacetum coccineum]|uniref:Uncharacterized protein n=1 Tax=Tanacetum coccineum TaxID=301880 RepID=A0ABQ5DYF9_9ASTR